MPLEWKDETAVYAAIPEWRAMSRFPWPELMACVILGVAVKYLIYIKWKSMDFRIIQTLERNFCGH